MVERERESLTVLTCQVSSSQLFPNSAVQLPLTPPPSLSLAAVVPASFNWLIFWQRAGQIGEAGSINHVHQHPQEAQSLGSLRLCVCVISNGECIGMDRVV